jgi:Transposase DDE domain
LLWREVTDEKVHDSKILKKLVNNVLDNQDKKKIKSVLADDGAYDSNTNFKYLQEKKIAPAIKVKRNSIVSPKNNRLRNRESRLQTKDLLKWKKKKRKYGHRDGWLNRRSHPSKECLVSIPQSPGFKIW